jgi:hypothetical protein
VATSCVLYGSIKDWQWPAWNITDLWNELTRPDAFSTTTIDCILCAILCSLILPILALFAVRTGRVAINTELQNTTKKAKKGTKTKQKGTKQKQKQQKGGEDKGPESAVVDWFINHENPSEVLAEPLLDSASNADSDKDPLGHTTSKEAERANFQAEQEQIAQLQLKARRRQNVFTGLLFVVSTAAQIFLGIKCIGFQFGNELLQGLLMGSGVLWINAMTWSLRELVKSHRQADGVGYVRVPALHPHSLCLDARVYNHYCDVCGSRIDDGRAYRCKLCDFDLCVRCFARKDARTAEGMLRGDKGVRVEEDVSTLGYFRRAVALARREWLLFAGSILMLLLNNAAQLWAPNLQGRILDRRSAPSSSTTSTLSPSLPYCLYLPLSLSLSRSLAISSSRSRTRSPSSRSRSP